MTVNPIDVQIGAMYDHLDDRYDLYGDMEPGGRCNPASSYKDCSGFCNMGLNAARKVLGLPEIPCWQADTFQFEALARKQNLFVPLDYARRTRGIWVGWNRNGKGHMGASIGDGRTIEARSHALDLGIFTFDGREWEWAMRPPGLTAAMFALPPGPIPGPTTITEARAMGMTAAALVPHGKAQANPPQWKGRKPFVAAILHSDDRTDVVGFNGATIRGGESYNGMHVRHLGFLHKPIAEFDADDDGTLVGLAEDGGSFTFVVNAYYP